MVLSDSPEVWSATADKTVAIAEAQGWLCVVAEVGAGLPLLVDVVYHCVGPVIAIDSTGIDQS